MVARDDAISLPKSRSYLEPQTSQHHRVLLLRKHKNPHASYIGFAQEISKWLSIIPIFNLPINGIYRGYNPLILTFDPNFLGHPSGTSVVRCNTLTYPPPRNRRLIWSYYGKLNGQ